MAMHTHCYSHCLKLSIATSCKVQEVRNLVGVINELYLFLDISPKRQRFLSEYWQNTCQIVDTPSGLVFLRHVGFMFCCYP